MAEQVPAPLNEFCTRCYICQQGMPWQTKALYCLQCDFTFCEECRDYDPSHTPSVITLLYEQYSPVSQTYKPANMCTFCKAAFCTRWECRSCELSACSGCIYDRHRAANFITSHLTATRQRRHKDFLAIMPPGWKHSIRPMNQPPHPECMETHPRVFTHCSRCLSVIAFDSCTYQCRKCAIDFGSSQRLCVTCYGEDDHRCVHRFSRLFYSLLTTPQPADKQIRFVCEFCPDLASKPWDPKLEYEHSHFDLTLFMTKERAYYTRLNRYKTCARTIRPLLRLASPSAICSQCCQFLEYWSDVAVCLAPGCRTSFCTTCVEDGFAVAHQHQESITHCKLLQTAAVASLGLMLENAAKLYLATSRHFISCLNCRRTDALLFFEGTFCLACKSEGYCICCLLASNYSSKLSFRCSNSAACFNFGLRSPQIFASRVPVQNERSKGFNMASSLRPSLLTYEKFPAGLKQPIRLLHLHSGNGKESIKFSLMNYSLSSCPKYTALSYTWGSAENPVIIQSNEGEWFLATQSLAGAFFRFRQANESRILWADAICIDQDDHTEKNQQVANMLNIYRQASEVLIWLGEAADDSNKALNWIRDERKRQEAFRLIKMRILQMRPDYIELVQQFGPFHPLIQQVHDSVKLDEDSIPQDVIHAVIKLFERPYFTRVWILQEVFCSRRLEVFCGSDTVDWDTIVSACHTFWHSNDNEIRYPRAQKQLPGPYFLGNLRRRKLASNKENLDPLLSGHSGSTRIAPKATTGILQSSSLRSGEAVSEIFNYVMNQVRDILNEEQQADRPFLSLLVVLNEFWGYSATDPRDKVYALLNLVKKCNVSIDYGKNVSEVFKDVALGIIEESQSLGLLTIANCARVTKRRLPSWVPDWSDYGENSRPGVQLHQGHRANPFETPHMRKYTASGGSFLLHPNQNGNVLGLSGYLVDRVAKVGPEMPSFNPEDIEGKEDIIVDCLLAWDEIAMDPTSFSGGDLTAAYERAEKTFCLTLSRGTFWVGVGDPDKTMYEFRLWRAALVSLRSQMTQQQITAARSGFLEGNQFVFSDLALLSWLNYTVVRTASGLLAMGLGSIEPNDEIALMTGCDLPLIVRASRTVPGQFKLVGPVYIHEIMNGEWWDEKKCGKMDFV